jgi:hypothetical protein
VEEQDPGFLAWIHRTYWSGQAESDSLVHLIRSDNPELMEGAREFWTLALERLELVILVGATREIADPYCEQCLSKALLAYARHRNAWRPNPKYL